MANSAELSAMARRGLAVTRAVLETVGNVMAMKADVTGGFDRAVTSLVKDTWTVFAGGQKSSTWSSGRTGAKATSPRLPRSVRAWPARTGKRCGRRIRGRRSRSSRPSTVRSSITSRVTRGFDAALHGVMELAGLAKRWRRPPFTSLDDAEMEKLSGMLDTLPEAERGS